MVADSSGLGRQLTLHMLVLAQVDLLQTPRMMVAHISHCRAGKTSGRSASYHLNGGTLCWHRRGRTGETTCAASSRQLGTEDAPSSLAWRRRASRTGCNRGLRLLEICCHVGIGTLWNRSFQQRRGQYPPSIIPWPVNVAEVLVRAQLLEGNSWGNSAGQVTVIVHSGRCV